jgi:hypothetical protein
MPSDPPLRPRGSGSQLASKLNETRHGAPEVPLRRLVDRPLGDAVSRPLSSLFCVSDAVSRVPDAELEYHPQQVYRWRGEPFTGVGYADDPNTRVNSPIATRSDSRSSVGGLTWPARGITRTVADDLLS